MLQAQRRMQLLIDLLQRLLRCGAVRDPQYANDAVSHNRACLDWIVTRRLW